MTHATSPGAPSRRMQPLLARALGPMLLPIMLVLSSTPALAQPRPECGSPWEAGFERDYRKVTQQARLLVENFHFTPEVEALLRGKSGSLTQDIAYTLRHFPNHPRALVAMTRLATRAKMERLPQASYSVDCYYHRAILLAPDDGIARALYAAYLFDRQRDRDAMAQVDKAVELAGENALSQYNLGLMLAEKGQWARAREQAHLALKLGFPRLELKQKLVVAGHWAEPPAPPAEAAASAATGASAAASAAAR